MPRVLALSIAYLLVVFHAQAQFASNQQTITLTGVTNNWAGTYSVGDTNSFDALIISNNGALYSGAGIIGNIGTNNSAFIWGSGSVWTNLSLIVGNASSGNSLVLTNGGAAQSTTLVIGAAASATNNLVLVAGGILIATNNSGTGSLVVGQAGQGQLILEAGTVTANSLWLTNGNQSRVTFNSGWFASGGTTETNGQLLVVGDGIDTATFHLAGGVHSFADGLEIRNAAMQTGCGTINGPVVVDAGGTIAADCGGVLNFTGTVTNNGNLFASNITSINFYGPVVNNGQLNATNGYVTFYSTFQNNGTFLNGDNKPFLMVTDIWD